VSTAPVTFPFTPKSTAYLERGFLWPVRLSNGRYSAAIVIRVGADSDDAWTIQTSRVFMAGLLKWTHADGSWRGGAGALSRKP
jgi:hypothetical protein